MLKNYKKYYDITFVNCLFDEVTLYFKSKDDILCFISNECFSDHILYVISCYDYRNHRYIYNLRSGDSD